MNKKTSTKERVFISLVGSSGFGKLHLIFDWLKIRKTLRSQDKKSQTKFVSSKQIEERRKLVHVTGR